MRDNIKKLFELFELDVKEIGTVLDSNSSEVYLLTLADSQKAILKIPYNYEKFQREVKALQFLNGKLPVPQILNSYTGDSENPSAMLLSYIDGESMSGTVTEDLAFQMGVLLAELHCNSLKRYGEIETEGEKDDDRVYINDRIKRVEDSFIYCEKAMSAEKLKKCMKIFNQYINNFPTPDGPCLVHTDYRMGNILVSNSKIVGLIDFEVAHGGSADSDFALISNEVWSRYKGTKESFLEGYKTVRKLPDIEKALPFYEFYAAFTRVGWCVRRKKMDDPVFLEYSNLIDKIIGISL